MLHCMKLDRRTGSYLYFMIGNLILSFLVVFIYAGISRIQYFRLKRCETMGF